MHIFELDRLLSQMAQDCSDCLTTSSTSLYSSSTLSLQINSSSTLKPQTISKKSIECIYVTPTVNKKPAPLAPHCRLIVHDDTTNATAHKFQRSKHKYYPKKMYRSENDLLSAVQHNEQVKSNFNYSDDRLNHDQQPPSIIQILEKDIKQKPNPCVKTEILNVHHATAAVDDNDEDEEELTWPKEPISITPSTQSHGIKKLVTNGLKLFISQPTQQHKRSVK